MKVLDEFTQAYAECALWASTDPDTGEDLDANYGIEDISEQTLDNMIYDCKKFQEENWDLIKENLKEAGHDFWLTRNGHGAGFWDGEWLPYVGEKLTESSKRFKEVTLFVGNNGKIEEM